MPPALVFQDISSDYAQKTVTVEAFPNLANVQMATVHPCKHSHVMKKIIDRVNAGIVEAQRKEQGLPSSGSVKDAKKKGWGLGTVVSKVSSGKKEKEDGDTPEVEGLRVDQCGCCTSSFGTCSGIGTSRRSAHLSQVHELHRSSRWLSLFRSRGLTRCPPSKWTARRPSAASGADPQPNISHAPRFATCNAHVIS